MFFRFLFTNQRKLGQLSKSELQGLSARDPHGPQPPSSSPSPPYAPLSRERETRAGQFPLANFVIGQANVSAASSSLSLVLLPPLPPSLFPPLLVAVVSPFVCLSACRFVCLFAQQQQQQRQRQRERQQLTK